MSASVSDEIERRYGPAAAEEWRLVRRHFELSEGFALIVLAVPDRVVARECRRDLETFLESRSLRLAESIVYDPKWLQRLTPHLLTLPDDPNVGAIWVEAVSSERASDHEHWVAAWRQGLGSLNQQRNPLRARLNVPLLIVGAPWVVTIMRETAPDLWSVRAMVARIERGPAAAASSRPWAEAIGGRAGPAPDPILAQRAVEQLRGKPGQEAGLVQALIRMAVGFAARGEWPAAEAGWHEALDLGRRFGLRQETALAAVGLAEGLRLQGRRDEAVAAVSEGAELYRSLASQRPEAFVSALAAALNDVALLQSELNHLDEALPAAEEAVKLNRELYSKRPQSSRSGLAASLNTYGGVLRGLGRLEEALSAAEEALQLYKGLAAERPEEFRPDVALLWHNLVALLSDLRRLEDALAAAERAVEIRRELAAERPDVFTPVLAQSLVTLAGCLRALERPEQELAALADALTQMTLVFEGQPKQHAAALFRIASIYVQRCNALGRPADPALTGPITAIIQRSQPDPLRSG
jgi:tetratricopeptide (TPR) repeat protein